MWKQNVAIQLYRLPLSIFVHSKIIKFAESLVMNKIYFENCKKVETAWREGLEVGIITYGQFGSFCRSPWIAKNQAQFVASDRFPSFDIWDSPTKCERYVLETS